MTEEFIRKHLIDTAFLLRDIESITVTTRKGDDCWNSTTLYQKDGKPMFIITDMETPGVSWRQFLNELDWSEGTPIPQHLTPAEKVEYIKKLCQPQ